jgi:hypothetical protein
MNTNRVAIYPTESGLNINPNLRYAPENEWKHIQNVDERRKVQNRIAQRKYSKFYERGVLRR